MEQVRQLYQSAQFEQALAVAEEVLNSGESLSDQDRGDLYRLAGLSHYNTGQQQKAAVWFREWLSIYPDAQLDPVMVSPKIIDFFEEIKKEHQASNPPAMTVVVRSDLRPGAAMRSLILPGWGQKYKQQNRRAILTGGLFWGVAALTVAAYLKEGQHRDDYRMASTPELIEARYRTYNDWHRRRQWLVIGTVALWGINVGDALLSPYAESGVDGAGGYSLGISISF